MGVAFRGVGAGGVVEENGCLTYAWRTRHVFKYNANIFNDIPIY
jgi:hypothetical protein